MINRRIREMIQKEIDGENTPQEKRKLQERLSRDPAAKRLFEDLKRTSRWLDRVPEIRPSKELKRKIMSEIETRSNTAKNAVQYRRRSAVRSTFPKMAFSFALGAACVILATTVFKIRFLTTGFNWEETKGSIGIPDNVPSTQKIIIAGETADGLLTSTRNRDRIQLEMQLTREKGYTVDFRFNPEHLQFEGIRSKDDNRILVQNSREAVRISHEAIGHSMLTFRLLGEIADPIQYRIMQADSVLCSGIIPVRSQSDSGH